MTKSSIYTKKGDNGFTYLFGNEKICKSHPRIEAYGTIDELNSHLGLIYSKLESWDNEDKYFILIIQNILFIAGSEIATPNHQHCKLNNFVENSHISFIEKLCDKYDNILNPLSNFILPGGTEISSLYHCARTICRRAERNIISFDSQKIHLDKKRIFFNRLSDFLFIMARYANYKEKKEDIIWDKNVSLDVL